MAIRDGEDVDLISANGVGTGSKERWVSAIGHLTALDDSLSANHYLFGSWDSGINSRRYWVDTEDSDRARPSPTGSYGFRVILAKW